jgi:hypothetical protein
MAPETQSVGLGVTDPSVLELQRPRCSLGNVLIPEPFAYFAGKSSPSPIAPLAFPFLCGTLFLPRSLTVCSPSRYPVTSARLSFLLKATAA